MMRAWTYIVSITALAAVLALVATGITMRWEQRRAINLVVKAASLPAMHRAVPALYREQLTLKRFAAHRQAAWTGCVKS
jgi:hypothetical protein